MTPNQSPTLTTKSELLDFLREEIQTLQAEESQPGWTRWALYGTAATALWLSFDVLERAKYRWSNVALVLFFFIYADDFITFTRISVESRPSSQRIGRGRALTGNTAYQEGRSTLLLAIFRILLVFYIARNWAAPTGLVNIWAFDVLYGAIGLFCLAFFLLSWSPYPVESHIQSQPSWKRHLIDAFLLALFVSGVWGRFHDILNAFNAFSLDDLRLGALAFTEGFVAQRLCRANFGSITQNTLKSIRRNAALNQIDLRTAIEQTELALLGNRLGDFVRREIEEIVKLFSEFEQEVLTAGAQHAQLEVLFRELLNRRKEGNHEASESEFRQTQACIDSLTTHVNSADEVLNRAKKKIDESKAKISLVEALGAKDDAIYAELSRKLDDAKDTASARYKEFRVRFDSFKSKVEHELREPPRDS